MLQGSLKHKQYSKDKLKCVCVCVHARTCVCACAYVCMCVHRLCYDESERQKVLFGCEHEKGSLL